MSLLYALRYYRMRSEPLQPGEQALVEAQIRRLAHARQQLIEALQQSEQDHGAKR